MSILRKIFIIVIMALLPIVSISAQNNEDKYAFFISPYLGLIYGQAEEIVYKLPGDPDYLSLLLWDLKPLLYIGFSVDFGPRNPFQYSGFVSTGSLKIGMPSITGVNENFDWFENGNEYSHYSRHTAYTRMAFFADISFGYSWRLWDSIALSAFGEFRYMHFSWEARDGFGLYPDPISDMIFIGKVVEYMQNWFILSPGISLLYKFNDIFSMGGNFSYSPLIFCIARDHHIHRNTVFYDYPRWGHGIKWGLNFNISPNYNTDFFLSLTHTLINGSRGDTIINNVTYMDSGGAAISAIDFGMGARFFLGQRNRN